MKCSRLRNRDRYLEEAMVFRDTDLIKVITGVRRCGKSSLLDLIRMTIESEGVAGRGFVSVNLESKGTGIKTEDQLYDYVRGCLSDKGRTYVFIDEPQRIEGWQDAVNAMRVDFDCDIYLTGSNAYLLSSELATYLSGRYVEVKMLPLSFSEFADFCGIEFVSGSSVALTPEGDPVLFDDMLTRYLEYGGMPAIASLSTTQAQHSAYMSGVYEAIAVRDIVNRERGKGKSAVTDPYLLRHVAAFLADNIGNECSSNRIAGALTSAGSKTTNKTVSSYVDALEEASCSIVPRVTICTARRSSRRTRRSISSTPASGPGWPAIGSRILGACSRTPCISSCSTRGGACMWASSMARRSTSSRRRTGACSTCRRLTRCSQARPGEREIASLKSIRDNHEKIVVVRQGSYDTDIDGIRILSARDFFL